MTLPKNLFLSKEREREKGKAWRGTTGRAETVNQGGKGPPRTFVFLPLFGISHEDDDDNDQTQIEGSELVYERNCNV